MQEQNQIQNYDEIEDIEVDFSMFEEEMNEEIAKPPTPVGNTSDESIDFGTSAHNTSTHNDDDHMAALLNEVGRDQTESQTSHNVDDFETQNLLDHLTPQENDVDTQNLLDGATPVESGGLDELVANFSPAKRNRSEFESTEDDEHSDGKVADIDENPTKRLKLTPPPNTMASLFSTGSSKPVFINNESMKRANSYTLNEEPTSPLTRSPPRSTPPFTPPQSVTKGQEQDSTSRPVPKITPPPNTITSLFSTASKKPVFINNDNMKRANNFTLDKQSEVKPQPSSAMDESSDDVVEIEKPLTPPPNSVTSLFSTASKKPVFIKNDNMKRASEFSLSDDPSRSPGPTHSTPPPNTMTSLFSTASKKPVYINKESMQRANDFALNEESAPLATPPPNSLTSLFSTASKKPVFISSDNMKKANSFSLLDEDESKPSTPPPNSMTSLFSTGSKKPVFINNDSMKRANTFALSDEKDEPQFTPQKPNNPTQSLSATASGKDVAMSAEGLKKARAFTGSLFETASKKEVPLPSEADVQRIRGMLNMQDDPIVIDVDEPQNTRRSSGNAFDEGSQDNAPPLLTTGKGSTVTPSKQNIANAKSLVNSGIKQTPPKPAIPKTPSQRQANQDFSQAGSHFSVPSPLKTPFKPVSTPQSRLSLTPKPSPMSATPKPTPKQKKFVTPYKNPSAAKSTPTQRTPQTPGRNKSALDDDDDDHFLTGSKKDVVMVSQDIKPPAWLKLKKLGKASESKLALAQVAEQETTVYGENASTIPEVVADVDSVAAKDFIFTTDCFETSPEFIELLKASCPNTINAQETSFLFTKDEFELMLKHLGASKPILTPEWIENHYRLVVWKLASYDRYFTKRKNRFLTPENVLSQLVHRYQRERNGKRSAIKRITERDEPSTRYLTLCVADVFEPTEMGGYAQLDLTDGWYFLRARIDKVLTTAVHQGKIFKGQKLRICGANISGGDAEACEPLDAKPEVVYISLCANSVRRVKRWDTPLGFSPRDKKPFKISLQTVKPEGGPISHLDMIVLRTYPMLYLEKPPGQKNEKGEKVEDPSAIQGKKVVRSQRAEEQYMMYLEDSKQERQSKLHAQYTKEAEDEKLEEARKRKQKKVQSSPSVVNQRILDGQTLYEMMNECSDPNSFCARLNEKQQMALERYRMEVYEREQRDIAELVRKDIESDPQMNRQISPFLVATLADCCSPESVTGIGRECKITIWGATEDTVEMFAEGNRLSLYSVVPNATQQSSNIRTNLSTGRRSNFEVTQLARDVSQQLHDTCKYVPRNVRVISQLDKTSHGDEFDTVGVILYIGEKRTFTSQGPNPFVSSVQYIYIWDGTTNHEPLLIKLRESETKIVQWTHLQEMHTFAFQNLVYDKHDDLRKEFSCTAGESSVAVEKSGGTTSKRYLMQRREELLKELENPTVKQTYEGMRATIVSIMERYQPKQAESTTPSHHATPKKKETHDYFDDEQVVDTTHARTVLANIDFFEQPAIVSADNFVYEVPTDDKVPQHVRLFEDDKKRTEPVSLSMQLRITIAESDIMERVVLNEIRISEMIKSMWQYPVHHQDFAPPTWFVELIEKGVVPELNETIDTESEQTVRDDDITKTLAEHRVATLQQLMRERPHGDNAAPMIVRFLLLRARTIDPTDITELEASLKDCSQLFLLFEEEWTRLFTFLRRSLCEHLFAFAIDDYYRTNDSDEKWVTHVELRVKNTNVRDMLMDIDDFEFDSINV
jgi:hypothetical protein